MNPMRINQMLNQMKQDPGKREMIEAIQNNDSAKGIQIADNIIRSYGLTREQAMAQVRQGMPGLLSRMFR